MRLLTHEDIVQMGISPLECYSWIEEAIKMKSNENLILPPKASLKPCEASFMNVMPCIIGEFGIGGVKVVNRVPDRIPSLDSQILLYDINTGKNLALLDGNYITAMRTGAVAAHSIKLLAKADFHTVAIMGLGNVTYAMFIVLLELYPSKKLHIKLLKYKNQHEKFKDRFSQYANLTFECVDDPDEWANGADVIVSGATYLGRDICKDSSFAEGVLLVPMHTRGFGNCDLFFDKIFGDDYGHISGFRNFAGFKSFGEVSDVVNGRIQGRLSPKERIIAYNIGIALHDIYYAGKVYARAKELNLGTEIHLLAPREKEWI